MRLGAHMSISGGKDKALDRGKKIKCETIQIFTGNVRSWASKPLEKEEITQFKAKKANYKIWPVMSHNSYLINLATTDNEKLKKSYEAMVDELYKAEQLELDYVNIHPGNKNKYEKDIEALKRIAHQLNLLINETKNSDVIILLETTAGQGNDIGYKFEHMIAIIDEVVNKTRIGITFDSEHSFASGYDFRTKDTYEKLWDEFDEIIGLEYLYAFHLNDSKSELGKRLDRHEHIGKGNIGKNAFSFLVNDKRFKNCPGILETPGGDKFFEQNLNLLRGLKKTRSHFLEDSQQ
ncbi:MAG: putative endonuclease 4 [Promethearchaeota archaeon]|nr:MAG: putative endonuclease 4 [Candidatus Lokiarchaeota archaeon]